MTTLKPSFEPGEIVYCDSKQDFFCIVEVGNDWVYGAWYKDKTIKGVKENIFKFRKSTWGEALIRIEREKLNTGINMDLVKAGLKLLRDSNIFEEHELLAVGSPYSNGTNEFSFGHTDCAGDWVSERTVGIDE